MHKRIQTIMRESLYGSPTLPQSAQSTFSPAPFRNGSQADPSYNFQIGTAEFIFIYTDEELNNVMKQLEPLLNSLGIEYWSVNKTDKILNISVNNSNIDKAKELYQQLIIDHGRRPRNFAKLPSANHTHEGFNPLCGDRYTVFLDLEGDAIVLAGALGRAELLLGLEHRVVGGET